MTRWKLYHEIQEIKEIAYFLHYHKNTNDAIKAAYKILTYSSDQGKPVNFLPASSEGSYASGEIEGIEFAIIKNDRKLQFYWRQ